MRTVQSKEKVHMILIYVAALIALSPDLRKSTSLWAAVLLLWYLLLPVLHLGKRRLSIVPVFPLLLFAWFLYLLFLEFVGFSSSAFGNYFRILAAFDLLIKTMYIRKYFSDTTKVFLYRMLLFTIIAIILRNISTGAAHYGVNVSGLIYELSDSENIASTMFYNMLAFLIGILFCVLRYERTFFKALSILLIALSYYFMLRINPRAIAMLLSLLLIFLDIVMLHKQSFQWYIVCIVITLFCAAVLINFPEEIILLFPPRIQIRLNTILAILSRSDAGMRLGRLELMKTSLRTWLSSPKNFLIGVGYYPGMNYISIVGQHTMIADYLAFFGCIGGGFLLLFFRNIKKNLFSAGGQKSNVYLRLGGNIFFAFLMISFTSQPISAEIFISAFLIYVLVEPLINEQHESIGGETPIPSQRNNNHSKAENYGRDKLTDDRDLPKKSY